MQEDPFPDKAEESPSEKQPCCQDMTLDGDNQSSSAEKLSQENPTFILQDSNVNPITANITKMQEKLRKSNKKIETLKRKLKTSQQRSWRLKKKLFP
jgi:TolA-binding protein